MSDDNDEKKDLTRIENLGDFLHDEDEDFSDLETYDPDSAGSDKSDAEILEQATDPNIEFPPEFKANSNEEEDSAFSQYQEVNEEEPNSFENSEDPFEEENAFEVADTFDTDETSFDSDDNFSFDSESAFDSDNSFDSSEDDDNTFETDEPPFVEKTIQPSYQSTTEIAQTTTPASSASETIGQLQKFAKNITYGDMSAEGNPPFSIIVKNIKYKEDVQDILDLLTELKVIQDSDAQNARSALERGSMLIPRLSEYAAIIICHKLRKFHLDLLMGLSEELQKSKSTDSLPISKSSVYGDYSHSLELDKSHIRPNDVFTTNTSALEGFEVVQYLGVVSERTVIDMDHFTDDHSLESELIEELGPQQKEQILKTNISRENKSAANSYPFKTLVDETESDKNNEHVTLAQIYQDLAFKLKGHAVTFKGNAVIGINYQVTPILLGENLGVQSKYQITCTGSVVWAVKK